MQMNVEFELLLHPRVLSHCKQLIIDGHYKHAALEAMIQVELSLKEKSGVKNKFGTNLCRSLFGKGAGIKLHVPFGDEMQTRAEDLFSAAFSYYRNYAAHDGSKIDHRTTLRILILASEMLDLIGVSEVCFADVGGIHGLVKSGVFRDEASVCELLHSLDGYTFPDVVVNGLHEELALKGFSSEHVQTLVKTGLIEYREQPYIPTAEELVDPILPPDTIGLFELTTLGKEIAMSTTGKTR